MADPSLPDRAAYRDRERIPGANPPDTARTSDPSSIKGIDLPIALLARQWRDPPDDFEDLVARTKTSLDAFMDRIDEMDAIDEGVDFRAQRLIADSLIDLIDTVTSTGRKPTRIGSGIAKALEALLRPDSRKECIATVNELRGMLSTPMLSESSFFTLDKKAERLMRSLPDPDILERIKDVVGEGQREFQRGLWEWVSGNPEGLKRIASVLLAIDEAAQGKHPLWRIAARFSTLMAEENASPGHALTRLVGQIDHQIRRLCAQGYKAEHPPEALLHNLLFHIEVANSESETARIAREDFDLGCVFEIPAASTGWPAAAHSKTMNLLLEVSASLEGSSAFRNETGKVRRDLIRARDAIFLAGRPDIARRMNRALDDLGDPQRADPIAIAGIVREICDAIGQRPPATGDAKPDLEDTAPDTLSPAPAPAPAPDLSKIPDFSRAKELMDRIDAAFVAEPGFDGGDAVDDAQGLGESAAAYDDAGKSERAIDSNQAIDGDRGASSEPSHIEGFPDPIDDSGSIDDGGDKDAKSEGRGQESILDESPSPALGSDQSKRQEPFDPFEAYRWSQGEDASFASDDPAPIANLASRLDAKDSALDILFERVRTHGDTQREIARGLRRLAQGIEELEGLAGMKRLHRKGRPTEKNESAADGSGLQPADEADEIEKARRLIPVLRAIAAHSERLSKRGQREGVILEKTVSGLRLLPLEIGIRRLRAIATRPRADGKRIVIDVRGEEQRCDPTVMDHLFPIIEALIETVIEAVIEPPSYRSDRPHPPPARLGLDFSLESGEMHLSVIACGRPLESASLARIRKRIDQARGALEILPSPRDRLVGLRVELPLTRWLDSVVVGESKKERFALFARDVVAILRFDLGGLVRLPEDRPPAGTAAENEVPADSFDQRETTCRYLEGEGFEYGGDLYPLRSLRPSKGSLPPADEDDADPAKGDSSKRSRTIVLLRIGEKRCALLCDAIESADECILCPLPPAVAEFATTAVVFADRRAPAVLIESLNVIEGDAENDDPEEGATASTDQTLRD
ncbi:hypothetical protein [Thioalkalivibrio sp. HK1]|uniref:hypothetical protein n=1 Tax=Thioalkalivibrio sp. HK1 TaxID=1469245 RepID=UPI000471A0DB|nr:hypothetical protein [Thioalkalivibrio sp. HK1]